MPSTDGHLEDLESSTNPKDEPAVDLSAELETAESSTAPDGDQGDDLLSVVRDVVKERDGPDSASSAEGEEDEGTAEGEKAEGEDKADEDDVYHGGPLNKHPRFRDLVQKAKAFEQDAIRYQNVQSFLDTAGLSGEEAADGLVIMGLMKTNPAEAWNRLKPTIQKLLVAAGEVLPDELAQRVQAGELSHEAALEVSKARAAVQSFQASQTFAEQQRVTRESQAKVAALQNAAASWEQDRRIKDPNFDAKSELLVKEIAYLQLKDGKPTTPEGVTEQLRKAYKNVNASYRPATPPAAPQRPAIKPITGGQVAGNQRPAEMSTLEIIRANRKAG